jgi:4-methoxybenzoate monooxygenase (O-demethylating)
MAAFPISSLDPFADDFLAAPYPFYAELREAGPVVWLERYGLWACARHAEVQAALSDWQTFSSAAGVGIDDFRRTKPWRPPSLILEADPPLHTRSRTVMNRALSAKPMAGLRAGFKEAAEKLADELVARQRVDAIADIAETYPLSVFPQAVGLGREGVENLLPYGAMVFNAFGPRNAHFEAVMAKAAEVVPWINAQCAREALSPAGLGAMIWAAVDVGEITAEEAPLLVRSLLSAGLDTTIVGIGNALYAFATNPAQWQALVCVGSRRFRRSSAPPPARSTLAGSKSHRTQKYYYFWPPLTVIRAAGMRPSASTSTAGPPVTLPSGPAFICASARCWRASRPRCS